MKSKMNLFAEASPLGFSRFAFAAVAFAALTLCGSVSFAEDDPVDPKEAPRAAPPTGTTDPGRSPSQ